MFFWDRTSQTKKISHFFRDRTRFYALPERCELEYRCPAWISHGFYSLSFAVMFEIGVFYPVFLNFFEIGLHWCPRKGIKCVRKLSDSCGARRLRGWSPSACRAPKLKSTFIWKMLSQAELETERSHLATIFGLPPTPREDPTSSLD